MYIHTDTCLYSHEINPANLTETYVFTRHAAWIVSPESDLTVISSGKVDGAENSENVSLQMKSSTLTEA